MAARRRSLRRSDVVELAEMLGATLAAIDADEMVASPRMRVRIEGALIALRVLSGDSPDDIVAALS